MGRGWIGMWWDDKGEVWGGQTKSEYIVWKKISFQWEKDIKKINHEVKCVVHYIFFYILSNVKCNESLLFSFYVENYLIH